MGNGPLPHTVPGLSVSPLGSESLPFMDMPVGSTPVGQTAQGWD